MTSLLEIPQPITPKAGPMPKQLCVGSLLCTSPWLVDGLHTVSSVLSWCTSVGGFVIMVITLYRLLRNKNATS